MIPDSGSLGLIGVIIGIAAIILHFSGRISKKEREMEIIRHEMDRINKTTDEMLTKAKEILDKSKELSNSHDLRPELSIFVTRQWDFVVKTFHNRFEKHSICRRIVTGHIKDGTNILLDSGSTIDLITFELLTSNKNNVNVLSNNVFAAMHLIGVKKIEFRLLSGIFNDRYAATYSDDANTQVTSQAFNVIIMATSAINFKSGIMVHKNDNENLNFKRAALRNFERSTNTKLIIAVDATKFIEDKEDHCGILEESEWASIILKHAPRIYIVTSPLRPEVVSLKKAEFDQQISKFKAARVNIDCYSQVECQI